MKLATDMLVKDANPGGQDGVGDDAAIDEIASLRNVTGTVSSPIACLRAD